MKEIVRDRKSNIEYTLHDSRIKKISFRKNTLTLYVDAIYQYEEKEWHGYEAKIIFHDCDSEDCNVMIFDHTIGYDEFSGKCISLKEFIKQYKNQEFEIIIELYSYYYTIYKGWLWEDQRPVSMQLEIVNLGDSVYQIGKQIF